jgi:cell division septation protein DedD/nucleoid DNA-binding protein
MQVDIGRYIGDLLYTNQRVSIPGLGSFVSSYQPAVLDPVQGELSPPSKLLEFNDNLVVDDGLMVEYLCKQEGISPVEAQKLIDAYVSEIRIAIENREIVTFSGLGRLYKDYEGQLKFIPDGTNYNTDAYGLPTINFYPIGKGQAEKQAVVRDTGPRRSSGGIHAFLGRFLNRGMALALGVAVLVVLGSVYILLIQPGRQTSDEGARKVPTSRVNVKPSTEDMPEAGQKEVTALSESVEEGPAAADDAPEEELDTESPTLQPEQRFFVIIIGSFGNEKNVERLVERIYKAGYEPYTEKSGSLTKVGVQKAYDDTSEINSVLKDVKKQFSKDAKVYRQ